MNLYLLSFQAVLVAVLVHFSNEVEAEKKSYVSIGNWLNSIEKKIDNVPERIRQNELFQHIKKRLKNILAYPSNVINEAFGTDKYNKESNNRDSVNKDHNAGVKIYNQPHSQELNDRVAVNDLGDMAAGIKYEQYADPETPNHEVLEKPANPKWKRKVKKHKKNNKGKHEQREHIPHEQRLDASVDQEKVQVEERYVRKSHKKSKNGRVTQRKFVKAVPKDSNSSESDEVIRRKPVDIIVHIKMND